jgi:hypothetical protein
VSFGATDRGVATGRGPEMASVIKPAAVGEGADRVHRAEAGARVVGGGASFRSRSHLSR